MAEAYRRAGHMTGDQLLDRMRAAILLSQGCDEAISVTLSDALNEIIRLRGIEKMPRH